MSWEPVLCCPLPFTPCQQLTPWKVSGLVTATFPLQPMANVLPPALTSPHSPCNSSPMSTLGEPPSHWLWALAGGPSYSSLPPSQGWAGAGRKGHRQARREAGGKYIARFPLRQAGT